uniref:Nicotinamide N-methyltransferase n=1 Tax=Kwoniella bestiolae CBS 10118 TaxID=1296100 RepID=A0A1B9FY41_9TREE|nr:hypothetical protein I302_06653 [Kwoniella bestiolae CBS 10118]OCF23670.1 hypothetical protein I302_06653 [Kwoniella bestiolae CBS 10118]
MSDPNFPPNLDIKPLLLSNIKDEEHEQHQQKDAIATYGIAGRVWEATRPLLEYFTPSTKFDPPCSLFEDHTPHRIIELGSGQSVASLHLAGHLQTDDLIVTTDLPEVVPLCEQSIRTWESPSQTHAKVIAQPLAWGEDPSHLFQYGPFTHIIMCDLIYFPNLYPPLLHTLLQLTESNERVEEETFGPEIILSLRGSDWEAKVFICRRWNVTDEWSLPDIKGVMNGGKGVIRGRSFSLVDDLFGSLEWDIV